MIFRATLVGLSALLGSCGAMPRCAPINAPQVASAPVETTPLTPDDAPPVTRETQCSGTISWDGRSPVRVVWDSGNNVQQLLDQGNAVNQGYSGSDWISGHYSSHGAIFRAGPNLQIGDTILYDCVRYKVTGRGSGTAGSTMAIREGLTVQYSGCGSVCFVFATQG